ncbi:MAG: hypothetical protein G01um101418_54 [Parcubacteria group bacterium Gr01-1014_18]|nr:MAG: hypothetical protein Greene041636_54 [Parcubacteria group bacterium Greene0416_36]TSC81560.1 MAG: hypothetical protein G01um101418_54 [Parcubacteria group bacterium Gr01-1014_18]TSC99629.1 MAG: hypothetical protein Greene101420_33 [Parcubacteria group bacterium Greene1014_20]TSD07080.1 MAG: hypothetical protein Greene07142_392 [Parcubacteria group bacterium Greene0714_2]
MEMLPIVCEHTNIEKGCAPRAEVLEKKMWCRSTNVFVMSHEGEILCHKRSLAKERMPGVWSTHFGGHVGVGESYESNAQKELSEEVGLWVSPEKLIPWRVTKIEIARLWVKEFVILSSVPIKDLVPQASEVADLEWKTLDSIRKDLSDNRNAWCAGTHDFIPEYYCMRSVLSALGEKKLLEVPSQFSFWVPEKI